MRILTIAGIVKARAVAPDAAFREIASGANTRGRTCDYGSVIA
ncbi:MAG TPA: hypothetical protein VJ813_17705 [Vicinamibacterales bacterium]|nr:hypothetical protein [Vicinamibacterales bacterium]